jgi:hypothetical protein
MTPLLCNQRKDKEDDSSKGRYSYQLFVRIDQILLELLVGYFYSDKFSIYRVEFSQCK